MCVRWLWRCLLFLPAVDSKGDETCWMDGVTWEQCCAAKFGPEGNGACWGGDFTFERCCIDAEPAEVPPELAAASATSYPACWHPGVVLRHAGENGIFADLSLYGHTGCFLNNCKLTDKFAAVDAGVCSRACSEVEECSHWTFGQQYGVKTCFLRKSDAGRAFLPHWISGTSDCAPPRLPPAWVALRTAKCEGLRACDAGKGEGCPDVEAAITTWLFAIDHMKRAFSGRVDQDTWSHIERIGKESANFRAGLHSEYRPSDKDFPRIIYNNRLIFNHLEEALSSQPAGTATADDASLPNPLRFGKLCGKSSCFEL
ncbi:hypothetical protein AK812_SmicGene6721 [Symbiodinium microadriaticum]|uniref:Uncharacterized protein n=1 Tax=Symbiodinium microadriaticum TaxID=2951 RepID=A0A1Q9EQD5_SYMMI|nr:hypothetical protein AK812_SmicGene6721 [Symbiodinium microadriaticum]CAE7448728.1 unnamed protein product [Symbiodinium microadriaticum]